MSDDYANGGLIDEPGLADSDLIPVMLSGGCIPAGFAAHYGEDVLRRLNEPTRGGALSGCCDLHNGHCEPPADLCCRRCAEAAHPEHPVGVTCVLEAS